MRCLIVGTAKTGTTALLHAVADAIGDAPALFMEERIDSLGELPAHAVAKVILEHESVDAIEAFGARFERRILLVRDPRDTLVSRVLYTLASNPALLDDLPYLRSFVAQLQAKQRAPHMVPLHTLAPLWEPVSLLDKTIRFNQTLAAFAKRVRAGWWFVLRYEDLVGGNLGALSAYLGYEVKAGATVDPAYARVARTKAAGDWRHWFTPDDVARLRPLLEPVMNVLGYEPDWCLAGAAVIQPEHSWEYVERLVHERRRHYGLAAAAAPLLASAARPAHVTKSDIVNRLVRQFGLRSYLEYNKFDGFNYYADVVCADKAIAYIPESAYLDAPTTRRLLDVAAGADPDAIMALPELMAHYSNRKFDLIFYDPVHVRPGVDEALRALPALLNPDGLLVVHDCNPEREELTSVQRRRGGGWTGETYKAFALLRRHNRARTVTVSEDFGVGLVWNRDLCLDYDLDADIDYAAFARQREEYVGLISYQQFVVRTASSSLAPLFAQPPLSRPAPFHARGPAPAPASGASIECQLFWRGHGHAFGESDSISRAVAADGALQRLEFALPATAVDVAALRFDFADTRAAVYIEMLALHDPDGALMWSWDRQAHAQQDWRNTRFCTAHEPPRLYLLATSADPQFYPALPASVLARLGPDWTFRVSMAPQLEVVGQLLAELAQARAPTGVAP